MGGCSCGDESVGRSELPASAAPGVGEQPTVVRRDASVDGQGGEPSLGEDECGEPAGALLVGGDENAVVQAAERHGGDRGLLRWLVEREVLSACERDYE